MTDAAIRALFHRNWVFILFEQKRIPYGVIAIGIPLLLWGTAALIAAMLGVFPLFAENLLAYTGPIAILVAFLAYGWFVHEAARVLAHAYEAFDVTEETYLATIKKWADRFGNSYGLLAIAALFLCVLNINDLIHLWQQPNENWIGVPWVTGEQPLFFQLYYGFYGTVVSGFVYGSGAIGVIGYTLLVEDILRMPLKLEYFRRLIVISNLSLGIAGWAILALALAMVGAVIVTPDAPIEFVGSMGVQAIIASLGLIRVLLVPLLNARTAIIRAKANRLREYEWNLYRLSGEIDGKATRYLDQLMSSDDQTDTIHVGAFGDQLDKLRRERDAIRADIVNLEQIPAWTISVIGAVQLIATALSPIIGVILNIIL
jgi:hypothetical protein